jgi:YidC/Oxa1 family membrane protein insertase
MVVLSKYLYTVPDFMSLVPLPSKFLWFDMGRPDMLILPILVAATTWLQQKLTMSNTPQGTDPQAAQMSQSMMITMPLMFGFFAMQMPAGLSVYFIVSNVVGLGIQWLTNRFFKDDESRSAPSPRVQAQPADRNPEQKGKSRRKKRGYKRKS